ncbi:MAG: tetratricopeptide repeat protein [Thermosynechococcaceae cyanobacterium]
MVANTAWLDDLIFHNMGDRISELQILILERCDQTYLEIADAYGCTEGHAKDVGSDLWKLLSQLLGEKVTKKNLGLVLPRHIPGDFAASVERSALSGLVGRADAIDHLNALVQKGQSAIAIQGEGGIGKTTLAQNYLHHQGFNRVLELLMAKETANITSAERVVEEWLQRDFNDEPGLEFGISLGRLRRHLQQHRIGILIDNLEPALDHQGRFIEPHRHYVELLRVLTEGQGQTVVLMTSRDRISEPSLTITHYRLPDLDYSAWQQFFETGELDIDAASLTEMHHAYGGNAKAMQVLRGTITEDYEGDLKSYWQDHCQHLLFADLKHLVVNQVNRLQCQDPQAYRLFCRLGCYRYQNPATVPTAALNALLWDVAASDHRRVIVSLRNRSLVDCHKGQYWLHPVMRAEAIARLRSSDEWDNANQAAATYWTDSVQTITQPQDALQALEAYYHHVAIEDAAAAAQVILNSRTNQWNQHLSLGSTLYRLGLHQSLLTEIPVILERVGAQPDFSELYNILGDFYWTAGKIHAAIDCQQKARELAVQRDRTSKTLTSRQRYYLKMLEVDALLSLGLYHIDLWELETAATWFEELVKIATNTDHHRWAEKASLCLALVKSYLGQVGEARSLADAAYEQIAQGTGRSAYFMQILGQTYVNIERFEKARHIFKQVLTHLESSSYSQIQAKTLLGLGDINRRESELTAALQQQQQALELLQTIGAQCDLAEAWFQLGITYQRQQRSDLSQDSFEQAKKLFRQMEAPQQVAKVVSRLNSVVRE